MTQDNETLSPPGTRWQHPCCTFSGFFPPLGLNPRLCRVALDGGFNESSRPVESESNGLTVALAGIWDQVVEAVANLRKESSMLKLFTEHVKGEEMYGLTVHAVMRITESVGERRRCLFLSLILSSPSPPGVTDAGKLGSSCSSTAGHVLLAIPMNLKKH